MQLAIDIGNTAIKTALFRGTELLEVRQFTDEDWPDSAIFRSVEKVICATVRAGEPDFSSYFSGPYYRLNSHTPLPFRNAYETPATLGADRIANVAGARQMFPGQHVLVVDTGTCIKMDLLTADAVYHGGSISPGLRMRYKALHHYTGKLPLLDTASGAALTGVHTAGSIHSGVINGMTAEIDGMISRYTEMYAGLQCILTGGDHVFFSGKLKSRIFAAPTLTLEGLNSILLRL